MLESVTRQVDLAAVLATLARRKVNYDEAEAPVAGRHRNWHVDDSVVLIGHEPPGPPEPDGAWAVACTMVRGYEFADPRIIRGIFRANSPLLGRDMLLEGRFAVLRFYLGVRVTEVVDVERDGQRVWGWAYQTLEGHLEQGKLAYEVVKDMRSGDVELQVRAYSRRAPISNPIIRLGFMLFGRPIQLRFYAQVGRRLRDSVQAVLHGRQPPIPADLGDGLVMAPAGARPRSERLSLPARHPGR